MPDERSTEDVRPHPLVGVVRAAAEKKGSFGAPPTGSSFFSYFFVTVAAVIGFSVMGWLLVRSRRRVAKLGFELRKKEEEARRAYESAQLEKSAEAQEVANDIARGFQKQVIALKKQLEEQSAVHASRKKALEDIANWDELVVIDKREG